MNDESKRETARAQRPRSPRVPVNFNVELEGTNAAGQPFHTRAEAVRISRGGATLITDAIVAIGATVRVTPPFGRVLEAQVNGIWTDETDGRQRIGVKLLEPDGWFAE